MSGVACYNSSSTGCGIIIALLTVLTFLKNKDLPKEYCRRQCCVKAEIMFIKSQKEACRFTTFMLCAAHSLFLVGFHAAECVHETIRLA